MLITLNLKNQNKGSPIRYVGGTVNGTEYIFEGAYGAWAVNVPKADDDYYRMNLQMVDEAGNTSTYVETFYFPLPSFVYDRTRDDVDKRTWKGFLNASDLNRIDRATELIGDYISVPVSVRYDWETGGLPRVSDFKRIHDNVAMIRNGYVVYSDTPQVPELPYNRFDKWNAIEKILHDVFYIYIGNFNNKIYCSEAYAGQGIGVL